MALASSAGNDQEPIIQATAEQNDQPPTEVQIRLGSSLRPWISLFLVALALWLVISYGRLIAEVIAVVFGGYLLSLAIAPLATRLAQRRIPRALTVLLIYLGIFSALALIAKLTAPTLAHEMERANQTLPAMLAAIEERLDIVPVLGQVDLTPYNLAENTEEQLPTVANFAIVVAGDLFHLAIDLTLVLVLSYIFVTDTRLGSELLFTWIPKNKRWRVRTIFANTSRRLTRWLIAQIGAAAFFAVAFGLGLGVLGVPFAGTIAIIGGLLEFVPFLGGAVSLGLASLTALAFEPGLVVWVVVLYFAVNLIQVQVVQPFLYSRAVDAHPAAILIALLVGAQAGGVFGALFAVPVSVVLVTLLDEIDKPGDAPPVEPDLSLADRLPGEIGSQVETEVD
jgi:predicted PurR-regulated permease PerM